MTDLVALLRAHPITAGLTVHDDRVAPWPGPFHPVGVVWHHTAGSGTALSTMQYGRGEPNPLSPPLGNVLIQRDAKVRVVCDGRANDTGSGSGLALAEVIAQLPPGADAYPRGLADTVNLNPSLYDIEVDNNGTGEPYPLEVLDALVRVTAVICMTYGWSERACRHHRQMTRRKIDMSYRENLWTPTALHIIAGSTPTPTPPTGAFMALTDQQQLEMYQFLQDLNFEIIAAPGWTSPTRLRGYIRTEIAAATGDLAAIRTAAEAAANPAEVAAIIDAGLAGILAALEGLPDETGEPVSRETVRLLLIELLEAAAES